jgi:hypothetical protein
MSIKIECEKCGFQNVLGRVFCAQCGVKLDLRATSAEEFDERRRFDYARFVKLTLVFLALVLILGVIGAALWPDTIPSVRVDKAGAVQIPIKAKAVRSAISFNRSVTLDLSEGELNGFLEERARNRNIPGLAIDLKPGAFDLYSIQDWRPATNIAVLAWVHTRYSMTLRGSFQNGVLKIENARFGHLPLPEFARRQVVDFFAGLFADIIREKRVVGALKSVAIEETRADMVLGP